MQNQDVWNNHAEQWNENVFYDPDTNIILKWLKKVSKKDDMILDQGCGVGQYALTVSKMGHSNVVGMDFSELLIESAIYNNQKFGLDCKFVIGDIRNMPFNKNEFDIIISAGIVEHVKETSKAISELSRVLKPQGYLFIHVPHMISTFTVLKKIQQALGIWKEGYEKSFTIAYFKKLLKNNYFSIEEIYIKEYAPGSHPFIGKIIKSFDKPLYKIGYGGHHMYFLCKKIQK